MAKENEELEDKEVKEDVSKEEDAEGVEGAKAPGSKGKKLLLFLIPLLLSVIGGMIYFGMRFLNKDTSTIKTEEAKVQPVPGEYSFLDMDDIIVTLAPTATKRNFLKMSLTMQIKDKTILPFIVTKLPLIRDSFQTFLREVRPADLSGSAGVLMLKNELLKRINKIVAPQEVMDVLFKEILVS